MLSPARLPLALSAKHPVLTANWQRALLAGFVVQVLLILFVTTIGLRQLQTTTDNLGTVVDIHMRKLRLTKAMMTAARERTLCMFRLAESRDPFERDDLFLQFNAFGTAFANARMALLEMPLNLRERQLLVRQGALTSIAKPLQSRVVDRLRNDFDRIGDGQALARATQAQNAVLDTLAALDAETQQHALAASLKAREADDKARFWMSLLSGLALLLGTVVAAVIVYYIRRVSRDREHLATHDTLTALPNRMLLADRLEQSLARAQRRNDLVGVMVVDLDRFKRVNDTLGHGSGDALICEVARRLRGSMRAEDIVARLGGDEFAVVVDARRLNQILHIVEKILATLNAPYQIGGQELFSGCTIGISVYPNDGGDAARLLRNADTAMAHAKRAGRGRFQLYDAGMNAAAAERLQLETELHYAAERNEFTFHYQPQLNLASGRIEGVEALIRWNHPRRGLLAPAAFLELLEDTGEIVGVGRALLLTACRQAASWHAAGSRLDVAINLSSKEFWHDALLATVRGALAQSGLPARSLHLELTENIFMEDIDSAIERIEALKALGVVVAIDDFGTGYSSLAHLKRFPLDVLKIDRYFVKELPHAAVNEALIGSILALCKGLGLSAVAEGVEDMAQLECLRRLGCPIAQGYLVSPPVPAQQIPALLERRSPEAFSDA
ncbi:putative bifunctional diguanylate cyclase/phosphodiesterase [Thiobacillus sedimenti]|uniref:EAL domain-containing protein n=1 Tax=Thiobacillus sedimenti TaxID=3110231 RepID=A0ABZ1CKM4_9PROT|nr:EAL domain-containing protein [Thiobacillus sp. SCUT-2]WRS39931.1 EAL domain-containing protein [Thiobacillus sp. SCUT-2]